MVSRQEQAVGKEKCALVSKRKAQRRERGESSEEIKAGPKRLQLELKPNKLQSKSLKK